MKPGRKGRRVRIYGVRYESIYVAALALDTSPALIRYRIKSPKEENSQYEWDEPWVTTKQYRKRLDPS